MRFTTVDPVKDSFNWYAYVGNDPINMIDMYGLSESDSTVNQIGIGFFAGIVFGGMIELGVAWDSEGSVSPYITLGAGTFVGASTTFTGSFTSDEGTVSSLDDNVNEITVISVLIAGVYDNNENEWEGIGGIGAGGGVLWTQTFTLDSLKD